MNNLQIKKQKRLIKKGDIVFLGNHVLGCGDSRDKEFVSKVVGDKKITLVNVDVPYAVGLVEGSKGFKTLLKDKMIESDHIQTDEEYEKFTRDWISAVKPHLANKNSFYIFNSDKMVFALRNAMLAEGVKLAQLLIWVKTSAVIGRLDYAPQHELVIFGWYGTHIFHKPKDKSVLIYPKPNRSPYHPSTKSQALIRRLVLNSTKINDMVYDGFLGSGTCLLVCEQIKRNCIGIEIDEEYCQTVVDRWEKLTGRVAVYKDN